MTISEELPSENVEQHSPCKSTSKDSVSSNDTAKQGPETSTQTTPASQSSIDEDANLSKDHNDKDVSDAAEQSLDSYLPKYGFKVPLDHTFPKKWNPYFRVRPNQILHLAPLAFRYIKYYIQTKASGRKPFIDQFMMETSKQMYGVPLGGIGSGTIGRGFRGEFCRYHMTPGTYDYNTVTANQFIVTILDESGANIYQKVLSPAGRGKSRALSAWDWDLRGVPGRYCGLYPRAWTVYDIRQHRVRLLVRQVSPVVPGEYKDSCLPVGVFVWTIENNNPRPLQVSITLTCRNGTGGSQEKKGQCWSSMVSGPEFSSVMLHHKLRGADLTYCLAAADTPEGVTNTVCYGLDPTGDGAPLWQSLQRTGQLSVCDTTPQHNITPTNELLVAVCSHVTVPANTSRALELSMAWDMPRVTFRSKGHTYNRRYTRWFSGLSAASDIASHALRRYRHWEQSIEAWQQTVLQEQDLPDWFKSALFNQLYFVADGGTVWIDLPQDEASQLPANDCRHEYGRFAYLESHEYRMYNTYDVHFYASWALAMLWPQLQRSLQYDIADYTLSQQPEQRTFLYNGATDVRKTANTVPHDVGDPEDEPFVRINAYKVHNVNNWKDLNLKFVLQVYRDYQLFGQDLPYLQHLWPVCCQVMRVSLTFDKDGDGLIENEGCPDQTYDSWTMHGPSAYCTSLWLASLCAMEEMAATLGHAEEQQQFGALLEKAKAAQVDKLWNGSYYNFDSCSGPHSRSIMADQLAGHWYLALAGSSKEVFGASRIQSALQTIYTNNVQKLRGGSMGAVNGMFPDGRVDTYTVQSEEVWSGVTYALAATMIKEGMVKEGFSTAEGLYRTVHEDIGLAYDMPEALFPAGHYRAIGYMRPLSIWSMWRAWQLRQREVTATQVAHQSTE